MQDRREFLKKSLAGAGAMLAGQSLLNAAVSQAASPRNATDLVTLGKTGIKVSMLAQGTGFNGGARQSDHTRMGLPAFERLVKHGMDQGINFLDMADLYGTHPFVKEVVKGLKREKYVLLSKIWPRKEAWNTPSGGAREEIDRFRKELGVDMIDICLVHCTTNDKWVAEYAGIRDGLSELKQKGVVRAVGVSCHDHGALKIAATHPWIEVIFARINNRGGNDYAMDGTTEEITATLKLARANGKAVVGMKIFGAGKLVTAEQKDASLRYVLGNKLVDAMTIGMRKTEEVDDSVERITATLRA